MWRALVLVVLVGCSNGSDEPAARSSSTAVERGPSLVVVREAAFGTAVCFDDPACSIVEAVQVDGSDLVIVTGLFPDSDADAPGQALCVVGTRLWDGQVVVLDSRGDLLVRGEAGAVPLCA